MSQPIGVIQSLRLAWRPKKRLAMAFGFLISGIIPVAIFVTAHQGTKMLDGWAPTAQGSLVLGGLLYSAQTVFAWARQAFGQALKSAGFVVLLEGVMVTSSVRWLALVCLGYLVVINGIAAGCQLALWKPGPRA